MPAGKHTAFMEICILTGIATGAITATAGWRSTILTIFSYGISASAIMYPSYY